MSIELIICAVGFIVITYFLARPKNKPSQEDKLIKEIQVRGLPPQFPPDGGGYIS